MLELDIYDTEALGRRLIKDNFHEDFSVEETLKKMGITDSTSSSGLQEGIPKSYDEAKLLMLKFLELKFKDHGKNVSEVGKKTGELLGTKAESTNTNQISIIEALEVDEVSYDELGNPILRYSISIEKINAILKSTQADLVNMSWQPGTNEIRYVMYVRNQDRPTMEQSYTTVNCNRTPVGEPTYYDKDRNVISKEEYERLLVEAESKPMTLLSAEDRYLDYTDGYFEEHTQGNVEALVNIAESNPDQVFMAAGGNPTGINEIPDITSVRSQLVEQKLWPENLIVVGYEYTSDWVRMPASFGADVYIDGDFIEKEVGYSESSSYATRIATEVVRQKVKTGHSFPQRVRQFISSVITQRSVGIGSKNIEYNVLDFEKAKRSN